MHSETKHPQGFIWTEALGCAEILRPMLQSFQTHHDVKLNVFIYEEDLQLISEFQNIIPRVVGESRVVDHSAEYISSGFKFGHLGTARLWTYIVKNFPATHFIHLDADTVFLGDVISPLEEKISEFGIVGSRRPYRKTQARKGIRKLHLAIRPDSVNTHCFAFRNIFENIETSTLTRLIWASERTLFEKVLKPTLDFFDPVTFLIRKNHGIYYLDSKTQKRSGSYRRTTIFEKKMISFSAVGSGYSFFHGKSTASSRSYEKFAISSYALYSKYLLNKDIGAPILESNYLEGLLTKLNTTNWTLNEYD
jgi:hypothetical protein